MLSKDQRDFRKMWNLQGIEVLFPKIFQLKYVHPLCPDWFWGNLALVHQLLNFLRNILISKWLPVTPPADVLMTHIKIYSEFTD